MKLSLAMTVALALAATTPAAPITYTLTFTNTNGGSPTPSSGSITYDASLPSSPFSVFTITASGYLFDLASNANNNNQFISCDGALTTGPGAVFKALTTAACEFRYLEVAIPFVTGFTTQYQYQLQFTAIGFVNAPTLAGSAQFDAGGTIRATVPVPEPSSVLMLAHGMTLALGIAWTRKRKPSSES